MNATIRPFLMFEGDAEEAMTFYVSLFPDGDVVHVTRYGPDGPGAEGTVITAIFTIGGQTVLCSDRPVKHGFSFTPSVSMFVECPSEDEIARLATALADGGEILMPLDNYGFSRRFTWVNDRFGVSWQLNVA